MVVDDEELPIKPNFSALSAQEQQKGKVEFRRVGCPAVLSISVMFHQCVYSSVSLRACSGLQSGSICYCCCSRHTDPAAAVPACSSPHKRRSLQQPPQERVTFLCCPPFSRTCCAAAVALL